MAVKDIFSKTGQWFQNLGRKKGEQAESLSAKNASETTLVADFNRKTAEQEQSLAKLEKLEENFGNMINHLEDINGHLKNLPDFVENQKLLTNQLIEYIKTNSEAEQRLIEAVQQMPNETAKANRRIVWMFAIIVGVCLLVILSLAGIIIYLK